MMFNFPIQGGEKGAEGEVNPGKEERTRNRSINKDNNKHDVNRTVSTSAVL